MTTINDLMGLARRVIARGEPELAGQISVLALETFDEPKYIEDTDPQAEADQEALDEKPLLEALENGSDSAGAAGYGGPQGETPVATVLELAALTKKVRDAGFTTQAHALNRAIEILSRTMPKPDFGVRVQANTLRVSRELRRRWALLCAKLMADRKPELAADVLGTLMLRRVQASEIKQFDLMQGDKPVLEELHEMLDELGYKSLTQMGEKRRKELENGPPGIWVPLQQATL
jgi:hypothetical protein